MSFHYNFKVNINLASDQIILTPQQLVIPYPSGYLQHISHFVSFHYMFHITNTQKKEKIKASLLFIYISMLLTTQYTNNNRILLHFYFLDRPKARIVNKYSYQYPIFLLFSGILDFLL